MDNGAPSTILEATSKGHVRYKHIYVESLNAGKSKTVNGVTTNYKYKEYQTFINPSWNKVKLEEEMAFAFTYSKKYKPLNNHQNILYDGITYNQTKAIFIGKFSDGTKVEFNLNNFGKDATDGIVKPNHIAIIHLKF